MFQYNSDKPSVNQNSFYQPSLCRTGCWALGALSDVSHLWPPVFPEQQTAEPLACQGTKAVSVRPIGETANISKPHVKKMKLDQLLGGFPIKSWVFLLQRTHCVCQDPVPVQAQIPALSQKSPDVIRVQQHSFHPGALPVDE